MRKKESVSDYKVVPEPNIPHMDISDMTKTITISQDLLPFAIEKRLIEDTSLNMTEIKFFSEDVKRAALLFETNEEIQDLEFLVKIFLNIIPHNATLSAETLIAILKGYQHSPTFSPSLLKKCIKAVSEQS